MLDAVPQPLGGYRWCALCPRSGRRCRALDDQVGRVGAAVVDGES